MQLRIKDIVDITDGKLLCGDENIIIDNYYSESNKEIPNGLFIGIKGKIDGSIYYEDAFNHGAASCLINNIDNIKLNNKPIIVVDDTIKAIADIAKHIRNKASGKFIGITGSVGKTCVKDFIYSILSTQYNTLKNEGNMNNHIGLPKTIMRYTNEEYEVSEIGTNHNGEIDYLTNILKPDIAIITNIGTSHIGNFGSRENIFKEKINIINSMKPNSPLIINNDDDILHEYYLNNKNKNIYTFGINTKSDIMASNIELYDEYSEYIVTYKDNSFKVRINIPGIAYIYNSLIAILVGLLEGISIDNIRKGLLNTTLTSNRMEIIKFNDFTLLSDCYNSAYSSIEAALQVLTNMDGKKIVFLGEVFELGEYAIETHKNIGKLFNKYKVDTLITIGDMTKYVLDEANIKDKYNYNTKEEGYIKLKEYLNSNNKILIKASNGLRFFDIVDDIKKCYNNIGK